MTTILITVETTRVVKIIIRIVIKIIKIISIMVIIIAVDEVVNFSMNKIVITIGTITTEETKDIEVEAEEEVDIKETMIAVGFGEINFF